jgi:hypothetical protein
MKAAAFYARFGITESQFRHGVLAMDATVEVATIPENASVRRR